MAKGLQLSPFFTELAPHNTERLLKANKAQIEELLN